MVLFILFLYFIKRLTPTRYVEGVFLNLLLLFFKTNHLDLSRYCWPINLLTQKSYLLNEQTISIKLTGFTLSFVAYGSKLVHKLHHVSIKIIETLFLEKKT